LFLKQRVKSKKTNECFFLINLAIADLLKVLTNIPMSATSSIHGNWMFYEFGCDFYGFSGGLFGFVSIVTMVFMSVERYIIIKSPFKSLNGLNYNISSN
jgi:c-opsin